jgi:hypothetical protein
MVLHHCCGQAGYRDGLSAGKETALQEGFDAGFADTSAPRGRELGVLRGLAAALLHLSSRPAAELGQTQMQVRVREIMGKLAAVRFADLVPPNEEATALHEAGPDALCVTNGSGTSNDVKGQNPSTDNLRALRTQLEMLLLEAGLNIALGLD